MGRRVRPLSTTKSAALNTTKMIMTKRVKIGKARSAQHNYVEMVTHKCDVKMECEDVKFPVTKHRLIPSVRLFLIRSEGAMKA